MAPVSRRQQVADLLRDTIVSGELPPGERLKQDVLCAQLGVSPGPLREAMRQLENEGLVTHIPNRGVVVAGLSLDELREVLLPSRLLLEKYAFGKALAVLGDEHYARLEEFVDDMAAGARRGDAAEINEADMRFHELVVVASGQQHTIQLWRSLAPRIRAQFYRLTPLHRELAEVVAEHRQLLDVLRTKDVESVHVLLDDHITGASERLLAALPDEPDDPAADPT